MSWEDILKESEEERKKREHRERSLAGQGRWSKHSRHGDKRFPLPKNKKKLAWPIRDDFQLTVDEEREDAPFNSNLEISRAMRGLKRKKTKDEDKGIDFKELSEKVWMPMLELKKLIGQRGLPPQVERMMEIQWMEISQKLDAATTKSEWEQGVRALKSFMNTVLNNDFRSEASADNWLKRGGFII